MKNKSQIDNVFELLRNEMPLTELIDLRFKQIYKHKLKKQPK